MATGVCWLPALCGPAGGQSACVPVCQLPAGLLRRPTSSPHAARRSWRVLVRLVVLRQFLLNLRMKTFYIGAAFLSSFQ